MVYYSRICAAMQATRIKGVVDRQIDYPGGNNTYLKGKPDRATQPLRVEWGRK
jgi:hypothetical protein